MDDQPPPDGGGIAGLIETIRARPALFGGIGALVLAAIVLIAVLVLGDGDETEPAAATATTTGGGGNVPAVTLPAGDSTGDSVPETGDDTPAAPIDRNPLTGDPLGEASSTRVVAVKVDSSPEAGTPIGIQDAELIIEAPVEGGITRLTALFFVRTPTAVGPVRSVRPVDADLLAPWEPVLVSTGGRPFVIREIVAGGVEMLGDETPGLFQQIERRQPYHLVGTVPLARQAAGEGAPQIPVLPFGDDPLAGSSANGVSIPFSTLADVTWEYDAGTETYLRRVGGQVYEVFPEYDVDAIEFATDTVIVMKAAQRSAGYADSAGADVPTFDVIGFGEVLVLHGGEVRTGQWLRGAQADGWVFLDDTGAQFTVPPGRVWLEIVPRFVNVEVQ